VCVIITVASERGRFCSSAVGNTGDIQVCIEPTLLDRVPPRQHEFTDIVSRAVYLLLFSRYGRVILYGITGGKLQNAVIEYRKIIKLLALAVSLSLFSLSLLLE